MFGFSFTELVVCILVGLIVLGPKDLPRLLRKAGQWSGKIRRAAADLRAQSGIDDALRTEGLADDINEIRKLARGELEVVRKAGTLATVPAAGAIAAEPYGHPEDFYVVRDREYPRDGADAYNALPDNAIVYAETLPKTPLHADALYRTGDPNGAIPADPPKPGSDEEEEENTAAAKNEGTASAPPDTVATDLKNDETVAAAEQPPTEAR